MIAPFFVGWLCYAWLPATGPHYVYYDNFPHGVLPPQDVKATMLAVASVPRNAMPSFHLSGALWILMVCAAFRRKWLFGASIIWALITAWATLALGEHYTVDLVVAMSFAPALGLLLMQSPRWRVAPSWQKGLQGLSLAVFGLWMLLLRLAPNWLIAHIGFVQALSCLSVFLGLLLLGLHVRCVWREEDVRESDVDAGRVLSGLRFTPFVPPQFLPAELKGQRWLVGIFFFSGFAGLVYEVVYAKALGVTFGGTALAANTVLMTYMGGMALGAWLGGRLAERSRTPLFVYALCEAAIGLYAILTPTLFAGVQHVYVALALNTPPDAPILTALRMGLGALVLGVPTVLMGVTLPLVFQCLRSLGIPTGRAIAPLYGANVLGASLGALLAAYAILPALGRNGSTLIAALLSLMVALYALDQYKRNPQLFARTETGDAAAGDTGNADDTDNMGLGAALVIAAPKPSQGRAALTVLLLGGMVTLALEVVFMHLLAVVAGNSVYAFGLMLATFLLGLGLGSTVGERLMLRFERASLVLWAQVGVALAVLLTAFVWDGLANYMGSFGYAEQYGVFLSFSAREVVRGIVCALAMVPPAFFIGMSYPSAMGLAADSLAVRRFKGVAVRGVGLASAANTLGNIAGVLLAAFWLLPHYGSRTALFGLAVLAILLAALMAAVASKPECRGAHWLPIGVVAAGLAFFPAQWDFTALSSGGNVYFNLQNWGTVIDHAESVEGGLTTVAKSDAGSQSNLTLLTNGKFQGNNAQGGEMVAQESFALIPLLHTTHRDNALVIGYGTGMTTRVLHDQGFRHLDVAELSPDVVKMADKYFSNINDRISQNPAVSMYYTDGRNYLLTQSKKYDLISLEITSIWFAGAANLYNKEFYEIASSRLNQEGVLQQWVQLHHMRPLDFIYIIDSVHSVFKYVYLYVSGDQGIIVASNDASAINNQMALQKLESSHTLSAMKVSDLPSRLVAGPKEVDALLQKFDPEGRFFVSTDNNLYLEYATPKGNSIRENTIPIIEDLLKGNLIGGQKKK